MLLFDRKKSLTQIMGPREDEQKEAPNEVHTLAQEVINAVHSKDAGVLASALHALFMHFESLPHEEYPEE